MNAEDPSQKDLTKIVKEIKSSGAKYILYEDNVSHKVTDTIRKETSAKPLVDKLTSNLHYSQLTFYLLFDYL